MKDFLILGLGRAGGYKDAFPYLKNGTMKLGYTKRGSGHHMFQTPEGKERDVICVAWWTTLPTFQRTPLILNKQYTPEEYPFLDNYPDTISVNKYSEIPDGYYGKMAVPISFLNYWCPEQFEILDAVGNAYINGKPLFERYIIKRR